MTVCGDLQIVASADPNGIGRREGEPVVYRWPWYWHLPRLGPWLLLSLAILVPGANRDWRALPVFLPTLVLILSWYPAAALLGFHTISAEEVGFVFESLVFGIALLWLSIDKIAKYRAWMRFAMSLGIFMVVGLVTGVSHDGVFSPKTSILLLLTICLGIVELVILTVTRRLACRCSDPVRFTVWLGICGALFSAVGIATFDVILALLERVNANILEVLVVGLFPGLCLFPINLAYMVLMSASPFLRTRLTAWLGAKTTPELQSPGLLVSPKS
jgi:hypothetical protein